MSVIRVKMPHSTGERVYVLKADVRMRRLDSYF